MAQQQINNGQSGLVVRTRTNDNFTDLYNNKEDNLTFTNYTAPASDLSSGTATGGSINTLVNSGASWLVNQWVDKVVRVVNVATGNVDYGVVLSNTVNTITFDFDMSFVVTNLDTYRILNTFAPTSDSLNTMIAVNATANDCAILAPLSTTANERKFIHVYIEAITDGTYKAICICRDGETQLGRKWGTLETKGEHVRFYAHQWNSPHWDLVTWGILRYATGYLSGSESIASATYVPLGANAVFDYTKRFSAIVKSGFGWLKYTSLYDKTFSVTINVKLQKAGAGNSVVNFALRHYDFSTGLTTDIITREGVARLANNDEFTFTTTIPITLGYGDEIIPIGKRDTGTITLNAGSFMSVTEL